MKYVALNSEGKPVIIEATGFVPVDALCEAPDGADFGDGKFITVTDNGDGTFSAAFDAEAKAEYGT